MGLTILHDQLIHKKPSLNTLHCIGYTTMESQDKSPMKQVSESQMNRVLFPAQAELSLFHHAQICYRTLHASHPIGTTVLFLEQKQPKHEVEYLHSFHSYGVHPVAWRTCK
jgi:hypothetical protein